MPSVADLVESHLLRNLTDPGTYAAGVELADRGAVSIDQFGPLFVRAVVQDDGTFVADLRSGPGKLNWSCSEPGGARGALCRHCVATAIVTWRQIGAADEDQPGDDDPSFREPPAESPGRATGVPAAPGEGAFLDLDEPPLPPSQPTGRPPEALDHGPEAGSGTAIPATPPAPIESPAPGQIESPAPPISGVHAVVFSPAADDVRAFFGEVLGLDHVDAGGGWLIFALPPAELAVHPADRPDQELYLMCADIDATMTALEARGVEVRRPARDQAWGLATEIALPGGTTIGLYQPKHRSPARR